MMQPRLLVPVVLMLMSAGVFAADWQALPEQAPSPADNPTTPAKVELGKTLYFDPRLSSNA
jgi:cytochrome c peroxidase